MTTLRPRPNVSLLPPGTTNLSSSLPLSEPGTLFVLGSNGGMRVAPEGNFPIVFGRNEPDVHVCVGARDPHVSRKHGYISRARGRWTLHNVGKRPIRFPSGRLVLGGDEAHLPTGHSPLFIVSTQQEHLLEVLVSTPEHVAVPGERPEDATNDHERWSLDDTQRLVMTVLAQRYLRGEPHAQPLPWAQVATELNQLRPEESWGTSKIAHIVGKLRETLAAKAVHGLLEKDVPPPVGNMLNHNLIMELLLTTTLDKSDLVLLEDEEE